MPVDAWGRAVGCPTTRGRKCKAGRVCSSSDATSIPRLWKWEADGTTAPGLDCSALTPGQHQGVRVSAGVLSWPLPSPPVLGLCVGNTLAG
jgi:hypothetical protein